MYFPLALLHFLGTKPLTVSVVAQLVVLGVALKTKDKTQVRQCIILLIGLVFVIVSIGLRAPAPPNLKADVLGTIASVLFLEPGVQALLKLRKKSSPQPRH